MLDNGTVKVGLNRAKVASITWLSWTAHPKNTVNHADPGRLVQQSYYAGRVLDRKGEGQSASWSPIFSPAATRPWNFGPHGGGQTDDSAAGPCVHIAPIDRVPMGPQSTYSYRYWLITGTEAQIAARLDALWQRYAGEKSKLSNPAPPQPPSR